MRSRFEFKRAARKFFLAVAVLSLAAAAATFGQAQASPSPTPQPQARRAQRPFPPPQYIPAHDYDQRNIKLDLRFDWEKEQAIGTATITLAPTVKDLRRVDLDAAFMTVSGAKLAAGTPLKFEYNDPGEKLSVFLDRAYQPSDELKLVISYHTNKPPAGSGGGLNFIKPRARHPTRPPQAWSQGGAGTKHQVVPCFHHPNHLPPSENHPTVPEPLHG